jgi:hypothetical protein
MFGVSPSLRHLDEKLLLIHSGSDCCRRACPCTENALVAVFDSRDGEIAKLDKAGDVHVMRSVGEVEFLVSQEQYAFEVMRGNQESHVSHNARTYQSSFLSRSPQFNGHFSSAYAVVCV